jgi:hypothetical protein
MEGGHRCVVRVRRYRQLDAHPVAKFVDVSYVFRASDSRWSSPLRREHSPMAQQINVANAPHRREESVIRLRTPSLARRANDGRTSLRIVALSVWIRLGGRFPVQNPMTKRDQPPTLTAIKVCIDLIVVLLLAQQRSDKCTSEERGAFTRKVLPPHRLPWSQSMVRLKAP